jgi:hypothetical protein
VTRNNATLDNCCLCIAPYVSIAASYPHSEELSYTDLHYEDTLLHGVKGATVVACAVYELSIQDHFDFQEMQIVREYFYLAGKRLIHSTVASFLNLQSWPLD